MTKPLPWTRNSTRTAKTVPFNANGSNPCGAHIRCAPPYCITGDNTMADEPQPGKQPPDRFATQPPKSSYIDFAERPEDEPSLSIKWRRHAAELAFTRNLVGQAMRDPKPPVTMTGNRYVPYLCVSSNELYDHRLVYDRLTGAVRCGCEAATYFRPCAHAGAVLWLVAGLCAERTRQP